MDGEGENTETWAWASFGLVRYTIFCTSLLFWRSLENFRGFLIDFWSEALCSILKHIQK